MEGDMQQEAGHPGPQAEASAEGSRRLELVDHLRMLADSTSSGTRLALFQAADEIDRLRRIIMDYAAICQASSREINQLRYSTSATKGGRDGDADGEVAQVENASGDGAARTNQGAAANAR